MQPAATQIPTGGRVLWHLGLMVVQLPPQDMRAGGDGARNTKKEGESPNNLASREEGLLLVNYSPYCSQTG